MDKLGWKGRLAVVLSALWVLLLYALAPSEDAGKVVAGLGVLPLGLLWGIAWAMQGYRKQHPRPADSGALVRRKGTFLRFLLGLGIFAGAFWYAHSLVGESVYQEVGYWTVFALICWGVLRAVPKLSNHAVILTVAIYSATISVQAYRSNMEVQDIKREIAAASPFLLRTNAGEVIPEAELARANLGRWEPFVRANSRYAHEQTLLLADYAREVDSLELEKLLDPAVVGSAAGRQAARQRLERYDQALDKLNEGLKSTWQRYFDQASVMSAQMPRGSGAGLKTGLQERYERVRPLLAGWLASQRNVIVHTRNLLAFVEKLGTRVTVVQSPPNLMFRDAHDLAQYRAMVDQFSALGMEEERWKKWLLEDERQSAQKLVDFVQTSAR